MTRTQTHHRGAGRPARRGFTLIEAIVIIVILGVIAAVIAPRLIQRVGQSKSAVAESNAAALATAMKLLSSDCGTPPQGETIDILWERPSYAADGDWKGPYVDKADNLLDPWGNKYILRVPGEVHVDFDIISYGRDGRQGGEGEDKDVIKG
jgi:general secretion pathway protein G